MPCSRDTLLRLPLPLPPPLPPLPVLSLLPPLLLHPCSSGLLLPLPAPGK
jgi:hypothetical protein